MDRAGLKLGALAGLLGISCCVHPGGPGAARAELSLVCDRPRKACSPRGARQQWRLLLTVVLALVVVYGALYWFTRYLASLAS
jgi:hypothetical protein